MFKLASLALVALVAVTAVLGAPILPRHTHPAGWNAEMSRVSALMFDRRSMLTRVSVTWPPSSSC